MTNYPLVSAIHPDRPFAMDAGRALYKISDKLLCLGAVSGSYLTGVQNSGHSSLPAGGAAVAAFFAG